MRNHAKQAASLILSAVALLGAAAPAAGGSIWSRSLGRIHPLHTDDTARRTGEMLTILIQEHSVIENETSRNMSKKSTRKANVNTNVDLVGGIDKGTGELFSLKDMDVDMSASTAFDGNADFDSDRQVKDQITVTVADVLPNGNLVVVGTREREVEGDKQTMQVSGVVRPSDITFANTVRSEQVAEFKIVFLHAGRENQFTRPGWLDKILNFLNPF